MEIYHNTKKRWTEEERALFNGAHTLMEITRLTGRTYASVNSFFRKKRKKLKLKINEDTLKKEIAKLTKKGLSLTEVKKITGASINYVSKIRSEQGFGRTYIPFSDDEKDFISENYATMKIKELAKVLNRTVGGVSNQIMRLKDSGRIQSEFRKKGYKMDITKPKARKEKSLRVLEIEARKKEREDKKEECYKFIIENKDEKNLFIEFTLKISPSTLRAYKKHLKEVGRL